MKARFLAFLFLLFASPCAQAQFTFSTNGLNLTVVSYTGTNRNVSVPNTTTNGFLITAIGANAFINDYFLSSVTIPTNATSIGSDAFENCPALTAVYCEGKPPTVASGAFMNAFLARIYYLPGVSGWGSTLGGQPAAPQIGYTTVNGQITITNYSVPDGAVTIPANINGLPVVGIASNAFSHCSILTNITIPASVTNIVGGAFQQCGLLTSISTDTNSTFYSSTNGALFDLGQDTLITFPAGLAGSYAIPGSVTNISAAAFSGCDGLTNINIPDTFSNLGAYAFLNCVSLRTVTMAGSVTNIGSFAFVGCVNLAGLNIPASVISIGNSVFQNCTSLTNVSIPTSVTSIGIGVFTSCTNLASAVIPDSVTNLGSFLFLECSNLVSVTLPSTLTAIGQSDFAFCTRLTNVIIPDTVTNIGFAAFENCASLTRFSVPGNVTSITNSTFLNCYALSSVTISASVTNVGTSAFANCNNLTSVFFFGNIPALGTTVFNSDNSLTVYYLPGTTNWGSSFGGRPTALWNPLIQASGSSFDVQNGEFGFNITGTTNIPIVVQASTNLVNPVWFPLVTNTLTSGSFYFSEPMQTNVPARYYRIGSP